MSKRTHLCNWRTASVDKKNAQQLCILVTVVSVIPRLEDGEDDLDGKVSIRRGITRAYDDSIGKVESLFSIP